jgi:uncharacterized protein (DUF1800 family)
LALVIALVAGVWSGSEPTASQTTPSCNVSYRVVDQWATTPTGSPNPSGGFKAEITITNSGTATMNGWNVTWTFANGQNIYQNWEGSLVQMGVNESVTNLSYNGTIAPSASRTFGFLATWNLVNSAPTMFGGTCSGSTNVPPTVSITAPANGSSFTTGSNINITANAGDTAPGTVASVQFFDGSTSLGTDPTAPYAATLTNATAGTHTLTALATDNQGATTTSSAVTINVANNAPPTVSITTPVTGTNFPVGANITINANASDTAPGTVAMVQFLDGNTLIGTADTTAPYSAVLTNATAGSHSLTARATDDQGAATTSTAVTISVGNTPPTVSITSPLNGASFSTGTNIPIIATATDADGTVARVEFLDGTALLGTDTTSPYNATLTNASAGSHTLTARAIDNLNATTTSAPITINVINNVPPTVTITAPIDNTGFIAPATVSITANASDTAPGTVASVQFFNGSTPFGGADTTAPYTASLANLAVGNYSLTAVATDNNGATTTSSPIGIGVIAAGGTTFVTNMTGASEIPPVSPAGSGTATLILSPDETAALVSLNFTNLTSAQTGAHVHGPADPGNNAPILFDVAAQLGSFTNQLWRFSPTGTLTVADIVAALKGGRLYAQVHTANHLTGEIRGWFPPLNTGGECNENSGTGGPADIARLLEQATFGPTQAELARVTQLGGIPQWIDDQFNQPASNYQGLVQLQQGQFVSYPVKLRFFQNAMRNPDQLRQRVAFALSQIVIAADIGNQDTTGDPTAMVQQYNDILNRNAFGNYRTLLREMTVSPIMGTYLTLVNSKKAQASAQPDENYIRELWQLFTVGTFRLNIDGSLQLDAQGRPLETYTIAEIQEGARALTGWIYAPLAGQPAGTLNPFAPMVTIESEHDTGPKTLLAGSAGPISIPGGRTTTQDLDSVIDNVFNHPNVGPFIGRQLIQHLVTSNPSPAYIARVASVFNNNGQGVRGDLRAVVRAILLDPEARGNAKCSATYGKLREPALFLTHLFRSLDATGGMWGIPQVSRTLGQNVFSPPDVFNFYQPDFRIVADGQTIFAPPAQILTTSTIIQRENFLNNFLNGQVQSGGDPNPVGSDTTTIVIPASLLTTLDGLAPTPPQLVDALNQRMMHGNMTPVMRQMVIDAVTAVGNNNRERVRTAIYIIASSMQYQVQR